LARLTDLGVLRLRDLLELPGEGMARRFGPETVLCVDRLMGRLADPREPYVPPPRFRARLELPAEAEGVEALLFPLRRMLAEFEGCLRGRGCGVHRLSLWLEHVRRKRTRLDLDFASPEREADFILSIAREKLGRLALCAPTLALTLHAESLLPYTPRSGTWLPGPRENALDRERLIERLSARLGTQCVFGIGIADDHRPEKGGGSLFPDSGKNLRMPFSPARPTWLLHRPRRLITENGEPSFQGRLELQAGPERIESGWWDGEEVCRDYYVASNARGETYWIFREHRDRQSWFVHGVFA
jgi:protein ImuB